MAGTCKFLKILLLFSLFHTIHSQTVDDIGRNLCAAKSRKEFEDDNLSCFNSAGKSQCVDAKLLCNGRTECRNGLDEHLGGNITCKLHMNACKLHVHACECMSVHVNACLCM